ncbi:unnamed protein product [Pleuronectes platessa]|uniref:Uncharacterized protein n=1 Tax=Pleuronectes platessa TaxID=8262 RepID=A0A9N7UYP0_PLEPL|nr:unnamed protein product [Pleuronectes platessa]
MERLLPGSSHSKRPGKPTPKAVDPTTQPIVMNKKGASDTKPGPVDVPKLKQAAQRSPSPGLVKPEAQAQKSGNPWKPAMRRQSVPAEKESHITQDLFKKVRSILNKLTPQKFIQLRNQLLDLTIKHGGTAQRSRGPGV